MRKRVVVTGIGLFTALGNNIRQLWTSLKKGETGIKEFGKDFSQLCKSNVYGGAVTEIPDFRQFKFEKRIAKIVKRSNKASRMAVFAGLKALTDAGVNFPLDSPLREHIALCVGAGSSIGERYDGIPFEERNPFWYLETYPNIGAAIISIAASIHGLCTNINAACTGATQAIGNGLWLIRSGYTDIALCGGFDSKFSEPYVSGFSRLGMVSLDVDVKSAIRPFDKQRNGFVMGEGAGFMVMESYESAMKRGAEIYGEICGYGNSIDGLSLSDTSWTGKSRGMIAALQDAEISAAKIDYINAHGTGTIINDKEETRAIKSVFGDEAYRIPVNSTKSMTGHTFAACGAIETAVCFMSIKEKTVHLTRNFENGDEDCDLNYVGGESISHNINYCMMNTSGIGGFNASLVLGKA